MSVTHDRLGTDDAPVQEHLGGYTFEIVFNKPTNLENELLDFNQLDMSQTHHDIVIENQANPDEMEIKDDSSHDDMDYPEF